MEAAHTLKAAHARQTASEAFHDHPSNPSSCAAYEERYGRRCPCEQWKEPPKGSITWRRPPTRAITNADALPAPALADPYPLERYAAFIEAFDAWQAVDVGDDDGPAREAMLAARRAIGR